MVKGLGATPLQLKAHSPSMVPVKSLDSADQSAPHSGTPILRIDHLLDGCLRSSDGLIRLSVRLEDSRQRNTVWAETFEERATNAFEFEDAFAEEVAGALSLLLSTEQPKLLSRRYTESHEAYRPLPARPFSLESAFQRRNA
jgi:hypothetical protein